MIRPKGLDEALGVLISVRGQNDAVVRCSERGEQLEAGVDECADRNGRIRASRSEPRAGQDRVDVPTRDRDFG